VAVQYVANGHFRTRDRSKRVGGVEIAETGEEPPAEKVVEGFIEEAGGGQLEEPDSLGDRRGSAPLRMRCATRCARVLVLPDPAPAITKSGPPKAQFPSETPCSTRTALLSIEGIEIGCQWHDRIILRMEF
jgi:hypothetical protein